MNARLLASLVASSFVFGSSVRAEEPATGAGGESANDIVKKVLVARNNTAVAEAEFMMKLFTDNVGGVDAVPVGEARTER